MDQYRNNKAKFGQPIIIIGRKLAAHGNLLLLIKGVFDLSKFDG